ncbi:MAG: hypothetical protein H6936_14085 [Burkholderiales bacterium]|nr:hypothetical protein [Nitrosomonas sp.]MCP5275947.1 hypothetical protein [Burkholderiales bacterium]
MDLLIAQIRNAFRNTSFPGNDDLTDSFGEEAEALVAEFCDKTNWAQLDAGFLNQAPDGWGSALSFFSGRALRFYLPAYLIADIEAKLVNPDPATRLCVFVTPMMEKSG